MIGVSIVTFALSHIVPADPAIVALGDHASDEQINAFREKFGLNKLHPQTQLYYSDELKPAFLGRIFSIESLVSINNLKKEKDLIGNVIVRNFQSKAEELAKKYKIISSHDDFIIFTQVLKGYLAIKARIIQHY